MTNERIAEIKARLAKLPKEPWSRETHDVLRGDNRYGSDPYNVLVDDDGKVIADSMNSDLRCIEGNCDDGFIDSGTLNAFDLFMHAADDLRALLAEVEALTSPPAPSGWQPIASAPKDMTPILVAMRGGNITTLYGIAATQTPSDATDWNGCPPTHWMPLPPTPGATNHCLQATPSGWQQRIAASMIEIARKYYVVADVMKDGDEAAENMRLAEQLIERDVMRMLGQNAKDALPPAPDASPAPVVRPNHFACATCGPGIAVDEDGCCRTCGADAVVVMADASPKEPR